MNSLTDFQTIVKDIPGAKFVKLGYDQYQYAYFVTVQNGRTWEVEVDKDTYDRVYAHLHGCPEWQESASLYCSGYTFRPAPDAEIEVIEQPDDQVIEQMQINEQARLNGATYVSKFGSVYYRKCAGGIEVCKFERGEGFTRWTRDSRSYIPEWAGVLR